MQRWLSPRDARATGFGSLDEDELQRGVRDGEVGIARLTLGRGGSEEPGVEIDCGVEVSDVESKLDA
jgi:hypothetical protein